MLRTTISEDYLKDRGGSVYEFRNNLSEGHRLGQAFFNALSVRDRTRIRGTQFDMFYRDGTSAKELIHKAIEHLLDTE